MKMRFGTASRSTPRSKLHYGLAAAAILSIAGATSAYAGSGLWGGKANSPPLYYYNEPYTTASMPAPSGAYLSGTSPYLTSIYVSGDNYVAPSGSQIVSILCLNSTSQCYGPYVNETYSLSWSAGTQVPASVIVAWEAYQASTVNSGYNYVIPKGPLNSSPTQVSVAYSW